MADGNSPYVNLISEFFHEAIGRVLPGFVLMTLYGYHFLHREPRVFHHHPLFFGLAILSAAWLIGLTLDLFIFSPFFLFCKLYRRAVLLFHKLYRKVTASRRCLFIFRVLFFLHKIYRTVTALPREPAEKRPPEEQNRDKALDAIRLRKYMGEKILLRSSAVVSIITIFCPPPLITNEAPFEWHAFYGVILWLGFTVCWLLAHWFKPLQLK